MCTHQNNVTFYAKEERAVARPFLISLASARRWTCPWVPPFRLFRLNDIRSRWCCSEHSQRHNSENGLSDNHFDHDIPSTSSLRLVVQLRFPISTTPPPKGTRIFMLGPASDVLQQISSETLASHHPNASHEWRYCLFRSLS
jgi:hypothetical protein